MPIQVSAPNLGQAFDLNNPEITPEVLAKAKEILGIPQDQPFPMDQVNPRPAPAPRPRLPLPSLPPDMNPWAGMAPAIPQLPAASNDLWSLLDTPAPTPTPTAQPHIIPFPAQSQPADPHEWRGWQGMDQLLELLMPLMQGAQSVLGYLGSSLDKLGGREFRGLLGGKPQELLSIVPFSDQIGWTNPNDIVSGRDLLNQWNLTDPNDKGWGAHLAGMGTEMALDPLSIIGLGATGLRGARALGGMAREANAAGNLAGMASLPSRLGQPLSMGADPAMEAIQAMGGGARKPYFDNIPSFGPTQFEEIFGRNPAVDVGQGLKADDLMDKTMDGPPPPKMNKGILDELINPQPGAAQPMADVNPFGDVNPNKVMSGTRPSRPGQARPPIADHMPGYGVTKFRKTFGKNPALDGGMELSQEDQLMQMLGDVGEPSVPFGPEAMAQAPVIQPPAMPPMLQQPPAATQRNFLGLTIKDVHGNPIMDNQVHGDFLGRSGRTYPMGEPGLDSVGLIEQIMNSGVPMPLALGTYMAGHANNPQRQRPMPRPLPANFKPMGGMVGLD